jgi:hypothetical protein
LAILFTLIVFLGVCWSGLSHIFTFFLKRKLIFNLKCIFVHLGLFQLIVNRIKKRQRLRYRLQVLSNQ